MLKKCISKEWFFAEGKDPYKSVDLPHDFAVSKKRSANAPTGTDNGYYPEGSGKYTKYLTLDKSRHYILDVDGAYMCAKVYLNESLISHHPYGYTPYLTDLTPYVTDECQNKLQILTTALPCSCRWYTGNGIYRDVFLWEGGNVRIEPWDMFISTVSADEKRANIRLKFSVTADVSADALIRFEISAPSGESVLTYEMNASVCANEKAELEHLIELDSPMLWDTESPNIYTLKTEIFVDSECVDTSYNDFGIRTIHIDAKNGLLLNSKPIKLRGGCMHHDHAVLGAASFPAAEERKVRLIKEAGFNAIRTAHNPPSLAFLEVCDRLGMIVMDEAFDNWSKGKCYNDYSLFFADWCRRDISYMVLRDRNHPCVFSYSIGNEIHEIDGTSKAAEWSALLAAEVRKHDDTRAVTSGIQKWFSVRRPEPTDPEDYCEYLKRHHTYENVREINEVTKGYEAPLDIIGCNYYYTEYQNEHECYPERVIWGSETHTLTFFDSWALTRDNQFILGDFTWTAFDNMGEVGAGRSEWERDGVITGLRLGDYPWRSNFQGDLDMCGYRNPQSYFRNSVWFGTPELKIFSEHPEHFGEGFTGTGWHWYDVSESWTYDDKYTGKPTKVHTYTDAERVEWIVNGKKVCECIPEKAIAEAIVPYEKGEITAIAYKNGAECARASLSTTGNAAAIDVVPEKAEFTADNRDLCYFNISINDTAGRIVTDAKNELHCMVSGGELMGIYSADPCNEDIYGEPKCHAYGGRALAIVRAKQPGEVSITVYSDTLASGNAKVVAK